VVALAALRNPAWVDGVGPGWRPTDTYLARHRAAGGLDAILLSGCFLGAPTGPPVRVFDDLATTSEAVGAALMQRWAGPAHGGRASLHRVVELVAGDAEAVALEAQGEVEGGDAAWLTLGVDALSSNPAERWETVQPLGTASDPHPACSWPGDTLAAGGASGWRLTSAGGSELTLTAASRAVAVRFACTAQGVLQSVQWDVPLSPAGAAAFTARLAWRRAGA